jgi:hypothetical protein
VDREVVGTGGQGIVGACVGDGRVDGANVQTRDDILDGRRFGTEDLFFDNASITNTRSNARIMGSFAAIPTTRGRARIAVAVPVGPEPIERLLGINMSRGHPALHGERIMDDGHISFVVDLNLDVAVGIRPVIAKLVVVAGNFAKEAESVVLNWIDALEGV